MIVRLRFAKVGKVRFTSHRDVARMWERALRRVQFPVAYSGGFSPHPKVGFGLALPTGCESVAEYLDIEVAVGATIDVAGLAGLFSPALPVGVDVLGAVDLPPRTDSLQQAVTACRWVVDVAADASALAEAILGADALVVTRERKGRQVTDDLRPAVRTVTALDDATLAFELATQPRGVRPTELLGAVRPDLDVGVVRRTHQWIERDGARWEPECLPPAATDAPHAELRAS